MTYEEWLAQVPDNIKNDPLWQFTAYPKALLLYDMTWEDCEKLMQDVRGRGNADQLNRSAGSISANIEEGYGRGFGKEYTYFLRVALGSARETRGWYYRSRKLLPENFVNHRMTLLDEIVALLVTTVQNQKPKPGAKGEKEE